MAATQPTETPSVATNRAFLAARRFDLERIERETPHGTRLRYRIGCKCLQCRAANSRYSSARQAEVKAGRTNRIIDSSAVRAHIQTLSKAGVGRRSVSEAASVSQGTIYKIIHGRRCREDVARAILAVDPGARAGGAIVDGAATRRRLALLEEEGYTKVALARMLGLKGAVIQVARTPSAKVTLNTAVKIERLYQRLCAVPA